MNEFNVFSGLSGAHWRRFWTKDEYYCVPVDNAVYPCYYVAIMLRATPDNSRYIPFTQQPSCCVPTCIQMVMYKNGIPLVPAEEIGYHLGLIVHPDRSKYFYNVRTSTEKPPAGYGTRIYLPEFEPNVAFKNLNIPLHLTVKPISEIDNPSELVSLLNEVETSNNDALLCFNHGVLVGDSEKDWGHVVVFDRIVDGKIRIIDPSPEHPKWRLFKAEQMFEAMSKHGEKRSGGIWLITNEAKSV